LLFEVAYLWAFVKVPLVMVKFRKVLNVFAHSSDVRNRTKAVESAPHSRSAVAVRRVE
jgi:hypothetical protein